MSKFEGLLKKQEALESQIKKAAKEERAEALNTVKELSEQHGFTASVLKNLLATGRKGSVRFLVKGAYDEYPISTSSEVSSTEGNELSH